MSRWKDDNLLDLALALARVSLDGIAARATDPVAAAAKKARAILDAGIAEEEARTDRKVREKEEASPAWDAREEEEARADREACEEEEAQANREARQEAADEEAQLDEEARRAGWRTDEEKAQEAHWKRIAEFGGWDHGKGAP